MNGPSTELRAGLRQALSHAISGLRYAIRTQRTLRIQLGISVTVIALAIWLQLPALEAAIIVLTTAFVLAAELFNTGVEAIVDLLVEHNQHQLAKLAKDIAAGGVVVSVAGAVVVGVLLLGPPLAGVLGVHPRLAVLVSRGLALILVIAGAAGIIRLFRVDRQRRLG